MRRRRRTLGATGKCIDNATSNPLTTSSPRKRMCEAQRGCGDDFTHHFTHHFTHQRRLLVLVGGLLVFEDSIIACIRRRIHAAVRGLPVFEDSTMPAISFSNDENVLTLPAFSLSRGVDCVLFLWPIRRMCSLSAIENCLRMRTRMRLFLPKRICQHDENVFSFFR